MTHRAALALALAVTLLAGCGGADARSGGVVEALGTLPSGQALPSAELPHLDGDGVLATADLAGTPAVINFWATWCAFCVEEMPAFEQVHDALGDRVRFVGVDREDDLDQARELAARTGVSYELVVDADGRFFHAVEGRGMPTTLLVDERGTIVHRHAGPLTAEELAALIAQHLDVRP